MINVHCHCFGMLGVQQHCRSFVSSLGKYIEIALFPWDLTAAEQSLSPFVLQSLKNAEGEIDGNTGIGVGVMNQMASIRGSYKVAYTVWETTRIPEQELQHLDSVDEVWIPSSWGKKILVQNVLDEGRVFVIPEGVDTKRFRPLLKPREEESESPFRFLCVAKWEARKGIDVLLRAWADAFRQDDNVELVLHSHGSTRKDFSLEKAIAEIDIPSHAPVIHSYPVSELAMNSLYNSCDAFVLPSRGEGWGLPVIEAMACGLPVIVTRYSAYLDYVSDNNAYLVDVERMTEVSDPLHFNEHLDYGLWAEPDVTHLSQLLRHVYENPVEASRTGHVAREDVVKSWTWGHAARQAWQQINEQIPDNM